jgi:photosystem II protein
MKISPLQIRLTKSRDNTTGTAIFKFNIDNVMYSSWLKTNQINNLILNNNNFQIKTKNLKIVFINGQPKFLYGIFIFKNVFMWHRFMKSYKENNQLIFKLQ